MCSSKSLLVLSYIFLSLINSNLVLYMVSGSGRFFFFLITVQFFRHHLLKGQIILQLSSLVFAENKLTLNKGIYFNVIDHTCIH